VLLWVIVLCLVLTLAAGAAIWRLSRGGTRDQRAYNRGVGYLRLHRYAEAVAAFKEAVNANPKNMLARRALIRAEVARKDFEAALAALAEAEASGLKREEADLTRARILRARARHRMVSAGNSYTEETCRAILEEEIDPAIEMVKGLLKKDDASADGWTMLGDLHVEKAGVIRAQIGRVEDDWRKYRKLRKAEDAELKRIQVMDLLADVRRSTLLACRAYERAIAIAPESIPARIALAEQYLLMPVPNAGQAKAVLEPILETHPDHVGALMLLGQAERLLGNAERALDLFGRVPAGAEEKLQAMILEADIRIEQGDWKTADELTRALVEMNRTHPWVAFLRARVLLQRDDPAHALPFLQNIFASDTIRWPQARFELARALMASGKRQQALQAYRDVVTDVDIALPGAAVKRDELLRLKYDACKLLASELSLSSSREAASYAASAFSIDPTSAETYRLAKDVMVRANEPAELNRLVLTHIRALLSARRWDDALAVCRADRALLEKPIDADRLTAAALVGKGAFTEAIRVYEALLERSPSDREQIQLEMADLYLQLERPDDAEKVYREMLATDPNNVMAIRGLAALLVATGRIDEANSLLISSRAADERADVLGLPLLYVYLREKRLDKAVELVEKQIKQHPETGPLLVLAAMLCWEKGDRAEARAYFERALRLEKVPPGAYRCVLLDLAEERYDDGADLAADGLRKFPGLATLKVLAAVAHQGKGDLSRAEQMLVRALEDVRLAPNMRQSAALMLGVLRAAQGRDPDAASAPPDGPSEGRAPSEEEAHRRGTAEVLRFLKVLRGLPDPERRKAAMAFNVMLLMTNMGVLNEARHQLEALERLIPDEPLPPCEKAQLLDRLGLHKEAVAEFDRVIERYPDFILARQLKAQSHVAAGEREAAVRAFENMLELDLTDAERAAVHWNLGVQCEALARYDQAMAHYKAATQHPAVAPWAYNNLAWILATEKGDPDGALPYALKAHERHPEAPPVLDTLGWIYYLRGQLEEAIPLLEKAARGMATEPAVRYRLGCAYRKAGRDPEALAEFREALALGRPFREAARAREMVQALEQGHLSTGAKQENITQESGQTEHEPER